jgi:orotate phosphoribosyltransferase
LKQAVARALLEIGAVGFTPQKPITFKSGIISPVYVDNRRLPYHPQQWQSIIKGFQHTIETYNIEFEVIAGVAVGGVPHSAALAYVMQRPSVFVRKEAKEHGKGQRIEGGEVENKQVLLLEDLVTTGGSSLSGVEALHESNAIVTDMLAIVSYGFSEAVENFTNAHITLHTLTDFSVILDEALAMEKFSAEDEAIIRDWFEEPHTWAKRHNKQ